MVRVRIYDKRQERVYEMTNIANGSLQRGHARLVWWAEFGNSSEKKVKCIFPPA